MNCKQGDLAIVINGKSAGLMVDVLRPSIRGVGWWVVSCTGTKFIGIRADGTYGPDSLGHICDSRLRPIRDQPGEDESLTWAGLPQEQGVAA